MIGAYAFVLNDGRELDYPLDLWLDWNSRYFDKLALAVYGDVDIKVPSNVIISSIPSMRDVTNEEYYVKGKTYAQHLLNTEWKVMLDIDEFVPKRIDTSSLDRRKTYAIRPRNFFGNLETEIVNIFPKFYFRIHYGYRRVIGTDAAGVSPPYAAKFVLGNFIHDVSRKIYKKGEFKPYYDPSSDITFDVWHTNAVRRPEAMAKKWRIQTTAAINSNPSLDNYKDFLQYVQSSFDYQSYKKIWPSAVLKRIDLSTIPEILRVNAERFNVAKFDASCYE